MKSKNEALLEIIREVIRMIKEDRPSASIDEILKEFFIRDRRKVKLKPRDAAIGMLLFFLRESGYGDKIRQEDPNNLKNIEQECLNYLKQFKKDNNNRRKLQPGEVELY